MSPYVILRKLLKNPILQLMSLKFKLKVKTSLSSAPPESGRIQVDPQVAGSKH